jgi:hypothetical protein
MYLPARCSYQISSRTCILSIHATGGSFAATDVSVVPPSSLHFVFIYSSHRWSPLAISGAVNSIAITPTHLASTSLDHFFRLHPAYRPPAVAGSQAPKPNKGETVVKVYMNSTPTAVVWDQEYASLPEVDDNNGILGKGTRESENGDEEDLWEGMDVVGAESDHEVSHPTSRRRRV